MYHIDNFETLKKKVIAIYLEFQVGFSVFLCVENTLSWITNPILKGNFLGSKISAIKWIIFKTHKNNILVI